MDLTYNALADRYRAQRVFVSGTQALARLPMLQREADRAAGLNTAGFVSGYRGSPLAGLDSALHEAAAELAAHDIRFQSAVNEELAATAAWGTQQLHLMPDPRCDGIFAMWYGKGPGVDRCVDVFKHAVHAGTARHGGVLVVAGDDHAARSSAVAHQSEHVFCACGIPVLAPASVQEIVEFGLLGWAMSRYSGLWVALKLAADVVESSGIVDTAAERRPLHEPQDFTLPEGGVHIRWPDAQAAQEHRMQAWKVYAALAWARANAVNRLVVDSSRARLGLIACGKAWGDLREAMAAIGLADERAAAIGVRVLKIGMPWPLEAGIVRRFAAGLGEILVVEEKRQIIEYQLKEMLYEAPEGQRPRVIGKFDEAGEWPAPHAPWLLPPTGELTPAIVARALASRLDRIDPAGRWSEAAAALDVGTLPNAPLARTPYFCAGCPHNRSTQVPEGSCALAGVGCHLMAVWMERRTLTISQMGGEGATWIGMAPHSGARHVFANMGDGTYFHSGLLAIRAAVAAGVNITYKILYNDAVAMTGGQKVDAALTVPRLTRQLAAEGAARIVVIADDPSKYGAAAGFAEGVQVLPRERLDAVQRELRELPGTSVIVYDQVCATEARRRRKRGALPAPARQVVIHEALCDGCGDCGIKSNCLAIVPVATEFGVKRRIDGFTCNLDLSCLEGECPALVTLEGATPRRSHGVVTDEAGLPEPELPALGAPWSLLIAGVGGTGVVTLGALLGLAAHLSGHAATVLDQTGLAQKGGAVLTHLRFARTRGELHAPRVARTDALIGCDLLVACSHEAMARTVPGRTRALINIADVITGELLRHPERGFPHEGAVGALRQRLGTEAQEVDATRIATLLAGHSIFANMVLLGYAWQKGWVPVGHSALLRAIELNGVAVDDNRRAFAWGRRLAFEPREVQARCEAADPTPQAHARPAALAETVARRRAALVVYQGDKLARRYEALVERVRRAEAQACGGSSKLAQVVAEQLHRLYAAKDEYEAARLLTDPAFEAELAVRFEGPWRLHYHLAAPWKRGRDGAAKSEYGAWLRWPLRCLAAARRWRGSWADPLRTSAEHRLDAALAAEYEAALQRVIGSLTAANLGAAVAVAEAPAVLRGFGSVKARAAALMRSRLAAAMAEFEVAAQPRARDAAVAHAA
jgi:indolepyruvate ferredoxin oxidoreductase